MALNSTRYLNWLELQNDSVHIPFILLTITLVQSFLSPTDFTEDYNRITEIFQTLNPASATTFADDLLYFCRSSE